MPRESLYIVLCLFLSSTVLIRAVEDRYFSIATDFIRLISGKSQLSESVAVLEYHGKDTDSIDFNKLVLECDGKDRISGIHEKFELTDFNKASISSKKDNKEWIDHKYRGNDSFISGYGDANPAFGNGNANPAFAIAFIGTSSFPIDCVIDDTNRYHLVVSVGHEKFPIRHSSAFDMDIDKIREFSVLKSQAISHFSRRVLEEDPVERLNNTLLSPSSLRALAHTSDRILEHLENAISDDTDSWSNENISWSNENDNENGC